MFSPEYYGDPNEGISLRLMQLQFASGTPTCLQRPLTGPLPPPASWERWRACCKLLPNGHRCSSLSMISNGRTQPSWNSKGARSGYWKFTLTALSGSSGATDTYFSTNARLSPGSVR